MAFLLNPIKQYLRKATGEKLAMHGEPRAIFCASRPAQSFDRTLLLYASLALVLTPSSHYRPHRSRRLRGDGHLPQGHLPLTTGDAGGARGASGRDSVPPPTRPALTPLTRPIPHPQRRIQRAMDISAKHTPLPKELWEDPWREFDVVNKVLMQTQKEHDERQALTSRWWMPYHIGRESWFTYDTKNAWFWGAKAK
jgi:hypothetical protein